MPPDIEFIITEELAQAILNYLVKCPYREVAVLVEKLQHIKKHEPIDKEKIQ